MKISWSRAQLGFRVSQRGCVQPGLYIRCLKHGLSWLFWKLNDSVTFESGNRNNTVKSRKEEPSVQEISLLLVLTQRMLFKNTMEGS